VTFNHAGTLLASRGWEAMLRLWDPYSGQQVFVTQASATTFLQFSPDDRFLAATHADGKLRLWEIAPPREYRTLAWNPAEVRRNYWNAAVSSDGRLLAVGAEPGVGLWDLPRGKPLALLEGLPGRNYVLVNPSSGALIRNGPAGLFRWPIRRKPGTRLLHIGPRERLYPLGRGYEIAQSKDGRVLALAAGRQAIVLHTEQPNMPISLGPHTGPHSRIEYVAVSPDGQWVATGGFGAPGEAKVWEARTGKLIKDLPVGFHCQVVFSPDSNSKRLLTNGGFGGIRPLRLWEVGPWTEVPLKQAVSGLSPAFSPDGKLLVAESGFGVVRLLHPGTGKEYARLEDPNQHRARHITFSPDGSRMVIVTHDGPSIHVWDLRLIRRELAEMGLDWDLPSDPAPDPAENGPPLSVSVHGSPAKKK
jgi:WD40 repeat protein